MLNYIFHFFCILFLGFLLGIWSIQYVVETKGSLQNEVFICTKTIQDEVKND